MSQVSPVALLIDSAGNILKVVQDGSDYLLGIAGKLRNAAGTIVNPATEDKQDDSITKLTSLDGKDYSTQTTLASALTKLTEIDTVLDAINLTTGIKKIMDALPVGDNWIGRTKVGDGTDTVTVVEDEVGAHRLAVDSLNVAGSSVVIGAPFPEDPMDIYDEHVENGGSGDLRVDGSGTPVVFTAEADASRDVRLYEIRVTFSSDDFIVDGISFGPNSALANGIKIDLEVNGGTTYTLKTIKRNTDFLQFFGSVIGSNTVINNSGPKDAIVSTFALGGLMKLETGTTDKISVTIQDDLTSNKLKVLEVNVYGVKVSS